MAGRDKSEEKKHLKLITLYREAVHQVEPNDECRGADEHRRLTLTMDYFDALEVKDDFADGDQIRAFFGQNIDEELNDYDVAMHSIPIYCPENEITVQAREKDPLYGDPFEERQGAGYLCLIQVYITPEVLRRIDVYKSVEGDKTEAASKVYGCFFNIHLVYDKTMCSYGSHPYTVSTKITDKHYWGYSVPLYKIKTLLCPIP